jgi:hypothetical protein
MYFIIQVLLTATPLQEVLQFVKICPLHCIEKDERAILKQDTESRVTPYLSQHHRHWDRRGGKDRYIFNLEQ